jgi:hypothetical protein
VKQQAGLSVGAAKSTLTVYLFLKELSQGCARAGELTRSRQKVGDRGLAFGINHQLHEKMGNWRASADSLECTLQLCTGMVWLLNTSC